MKNGFLYVNHITLYNKLYIASFQYSEDKKIV